MKAPDHMVLQALEEATVLRVFAAFCEKYNSVGSLKRLRNIYSRTDDQLKTVEAIVNRDLHAKLPPEGIRRLNELVKAYISKSGFRRMIPDYERKRLLEEQEQKCAICGCPIDDHAHADHVVPFKYVGDELEDNMQMLCSKCNEKKSANLYYQIQHYLGLV